MNEIKNKIKSKYKQGLALDIDETLSWTIGYWVKKMQKIFGNPENLSTEDLIQKYRYTQNVPYWQTKEAKEWMEKHRKSDEVQKNLSLVENSNEIVQKINKIVPVVAYITTRPENVLEGTKYWLLKHNFPDVDIIARPSEISTENGNKWKAEILEKFYPEIEGIVDDNPEVIKYLSKEYKGRVYLYNFESYKKDSRVIPCKNWQTVYKKIKNKYYK